MNDTDQELGQIFGWELILNLYKCDSGIITSKEQLKSFIINLCNVLSMNRYGEPLIERFGHNSPITLGYTVVQLVETSSITMHISELTKAVYMDIFSCKNFDRDVVRDFCLSSLSASTVVEHFIVRD